MSEQRTGRQPGPRPAQVTVAAGVAAAGSALLVLTLFDSMASLDSVAVRQMIAQVLAQSGHPWGLSVPGAVRALHDLMLVAGGIAAAATVLAIYSLFRHRGARIGLTVAAVLLLVTVVSGVLGVLVAVATAMLWTRPARDWFAGRAPAARRGAESLRQEPPEASRRAPLLSSAQEGGDRPAEGSAHPAPPPTHGFGTPQAHQDPPAYPGHPGSTYPGQPPAYPGHPAAGGWPPPAYDQPPRPVRSLERRPATVTVAAVLTWLFSAIAMVGFLIAVAMLLADRNQVLDAVTSSPRFRSSTLTENQIVAAVWVSCALMIFWCAAAMVLAFLTFRGHNWARITLVVSAAVTLLFGLFAFPVTLAHLIVAAAVIVLLFTGGANAWFAGRAAHPSYGPPPGSGYGPLPGQGHQPPRQGHQPPPDDRQPPRNVW